MGRSGWLSNLLDASHLLPLLESVLQKGTVLPGTQTMSSGLEMSSDGSKGRKKALCLFGGLELYNVVTSSPGEFPNIVSGPRPASRKKGWRESQKGERFFRNEQSCF